MIDESRIREAAFNRLHGDEKIRLTALANPFDKFCLAWCAEIESVIAGLINLEDYEQTEWFDRYLNTPPRKRCEWSWERGRERYTIRHASQNPLNREIAKKLYESQKKS